MSGKMSDVPVQDGDRWLIDGDCSKCRRAKYCKKPCTKSKRNLERYVAKRVRSSFPALSLLDKYGGM